MLLSYLKDKLILLSFIHELIKNTLLNVNWCVLKISRKKRGGIASDKRYWLSLNIQCSPPQKYTITSLCGVDLLPFLSKVYYGYN